MVSVDIDRPSRWIYAVAFGGILTILAVFIFGGETSRFELAPLILIATMLLAFLCLSDGLAGLYTLLFVLIPFSQSVPVFEVGGRTVNLGMHTIIIAFIIALTLLSRKKRFDLRHDRVSGLSLLLGGWALVTILAALRFGAGAAAADSVVTWLRWVQFIPIACLLLQGEGDDRLFRRLLHVLIALGLIVALWGIYESLFPTPFATRYFRGAATFTRPLFREFDLSEVIDPVTGYYRGSANYNIAGAFSCVAALMAIPFLAFRRGPADRLAGRLGVVLLIVGIAVTQSRSALLAFVAGSLVSAGSVSRKHFFRVAVAAALCGVLVVTMFANVGFVRMFRESMAALPRAIPLALAGVAYNPSMGFSINAYGAAMRFVGVREAARAFLKSPVVGWGFFGFSSYARQLGTAENFYFQFLSETGAVGFGLFLLLLVFLWRHTKRNSPAGTFAERFRIGFRGAFAAFLFVNLTGTLFYDQRIWGLFLVLAAIQVRLDREPRGEGSPPAGAAS